jgi:ribosomal protein L31E
MQENYTIRLNNKVRTPRTRRANRVIFAIREFVKKHTHKNDKNILISNEVNNLVWSRGKKFKINKINIALQKKEENIYVFLKEGKELDQFKKEQKASKPKEEKKETKKEKPKTAKIDLKETKQPEKQIAEEIKKEPKTADNPAESPKEKKIKDPKEEKTATEKSEEEKAVKTEKPAENKS